MPDQTEVLPRRLTADDMDTPIAIAAMDAIDAYVGQRERSGFVDPSVARQRIALLHSYLRIVEEEIGIASRRDLVGTAMGMPA